MLLYMRKLKILILWRICGWSLCFPVRCIAAHWFPLCCSHHSCNHHCGVPLHVREETSGNKHEMWNQIRSHQRPAAEKHASVSLQSCFSCQTPQLCISLKKTCSLSSLDEFNQSSFGLINECQEEAAHHTAEPTDWTAFGVFPSTSNYSSEETFSKTSSKASKGKYVKKNYEFEHEKVLTLTGWSISNILRH